MFRASLVPIVVFACACSAACGADATGGEGDTRSSNVNVEQFLMRPGEEPGFRPVESPRVDTQGWSTGLKPAGLARLRHDGFVSATFQPIEAQDGSAGGVTNVTLYETESGARAWMDYETSTRGMRDRGLTAKVHRFTVPAVPTARGWTGQDLHGNRIGQVFWVQGRCMLVLGNEGDIDFVKRLSAGAKAIYERTKGVCPS